MISLAVDINCFHVYRLQYHTAFTDYFSTFLERYEVFAAIPALSLGYHKKYFAICMCENLNLWLQTDPNFNMKKKSNIESLVETKQVLT